ncbi:MurR/RpiR family transcriptional regulator [Carnobacteriaceae bacterium zg-ZUI252]|nr:MurR/RpiR family transcriptional regulator [Carnobacteriaceae bacterium zg-ZUI252]MBS4770028.1 MurR/RpiR family transcriptional regulator [Carnobacteriaceae bacterium zg-ZUI240]
MLKTDILRKLESVYDDLSKSQKSIARYILDHPKDIPSLTVIELAELANSSPASVIRLCQSLNVKSFTLLKVEIATALVNDKPVDLEFLYQENIETIKQKLLESSYQSMQDTLHYLTEDILSRANTVIEQSDILYVYGVGASYLTAENIAQKWTRVGKMAMGSNDHHLTATRLSAYKEKAALILVSNSGYTKEALNLLKIAKDNGVKTIALTQFGNNPLAQKADVSIQTVKTNESEYRSAATSSLHVQFITVDILFFYYMSFHYDEVISSVRKTRENIKRLNQ